MLVVQWAALVRCRGSPSRPSKAEPVPGWICRPRSSRRARRRAVPFGRRPESAGDGRDGRDVVRSQPKRGSAPRGTSENSRRRTKSARKCEYITDDADARVLFRTPEYHLLWTFRALGRHALVDPPYSGLALAAWLPGRTGSIPCGESALRPRGGALDQAEGTCATWQIEEPIPSRRHWRRSRESARYTLPGPSRSGGPRHVVPSLSKRPARGDARRHDVPCLQTRAFVGSSAIRGSADHGPMDFRIVDGAKVLAGTRAGRSLRGQGAGPDGLGGGERRGSNAPGAAGSPVPARAGGRQGRDRQDPGRGRAIPECPILPGGRDSGARAIAPWMTPSAS